MERTALFVLLAVTFAGGMLGNLGPTLLMRGRRGREIVSGWRWWGVAIYSLSVAGFVAVVVVWAFRTLLQEQQASSDIGSPWLFFLLGIAAGIPFSIATLFSVRRAERIAKERQRRKKPASRQERLDFAKRLEKQLREFSPDLKDAQVKVKGKESTVVVFHGGVTREQAERLVNVLRGDLVDLGIQRIESGSADENWWVRVK